MLVKVCGLKVQNQVTELDSIVDFLGFIYYKNSKRFIEKASISETAKRVGVFVNESNDNIMKIAKRDALNYLQLHGDESANMCKELRNSFKIIKAFGIDDSFEFSKLKEYEPHVDYFLFDTQSKHYGGTGKQFSWQLLQNYDLKKPFLLSGGIQPESVSELKKIKHPLLVGFDLNSGFEISPANKNCSLIKKFIDEINN